MAIAAVTIGVTPHLPLDSVAVVCFFQPARRMKGAVLARNMKMPGRRSVRRGRSVPGGRLRGHHLAAESTHHSYSPNDASNHSDPDDARPPPSSKRIDTGAALALVGERIG